MRLEEDASSNNVSGQGMFQFQGGAVRRQQRYKGQDLQPRFQFQGGAVRSNYTDFVSKTRRAFQFQGGAVRRKF